MTLNAKLKQKSDASPVECCHRKLARGNVWDSLADLLLMLRGIGADNVKDVNR